ncbi:MAG: DoxX family protein [Halobacteriovoraceae bacterium]|nr:DoxX family protein [Halobacteriovoraceae bacterium]
MRFQFPNLGIFIIRIVIGLMFIYYGYPKLMGGMAKWTQLGKSMGFLGISFYPAFWGFMAAVAEFGGGLALATGFLTRSFCVLLVCTMIVAFAYHIGKGDGFFEAAHALELLGVCAGLFFTGPGSLSLETVIRKLRA